MIWISLGVFGSVIWDLIFTTIIFQDMSRGLRLQTRLVYNTGLSSKSFSSCHATVYVSESVIVTGFIRLQEKKVP